MDHHQDRATSGRVGIIAGMDSDTSGPKVTGAVPHVPVSYGCRAAMIAGTVAIAIIADIGVRLADSRFQSRSTKAFKTFVLRG